MASNVDSLDAFDYKSIAETLRKIEGKTTRGKSYEIGRGIALYCDCCGKKALFVASTVSECAGIAREENWKIKIGTETATCPSCC